MGRFYSARVAVDDEQAIAVGWAPVERVAIRSLFAFLPARRFSDAPVVRPRSSRVACPPCTVA